MAANGRVLVVDDDPAIRSVLCRDLSSWGYACDEAENGEDALERLRRDEVDLALIDLKMPIMDGLSLLAALQEEQIETVPIVLTGYGEVSNAVEAMKKGAFDFIEKPASAELIQASVEKAMLHRQAVRHAQEMTSLAEQWEITFDASPDMIIVLDLDLHLLRCNRATADRLRVPRETLLGRNCHDALCKEDHSRESCPLTLPLKPRPLRSVEFHQHAWNGSFALTTVPLNGHSGKQWGWLCVIRDVTTSHQATRRLLDSQRLLQSALDALSSSVLILDSAGTILAVNEAWRRFAGGEGLDYKNYGIGQSYLALCERFSAGDPFDIARVAQVIQDVAAGRLPRGAVCCSSSDPHNKRWFHIRVSRFLDGEDIRLVISHADITERVLAEEALRESEEKYRSMMEAMDDMVYICSADYRIEYMNPALIRHIGRDATGEYCYQALHGRSGSCPWCVNSLVQQGQRRQFELTRPEEGRVYSVSNSPIHHADGRISKLGIIRDITEQKRAEENLKKRLEFEKLASVISGRFVGVSDFDEAVAASLAEMGALSGASRVSLILFRQGGKFADVCGEWCAEGVQPTKQELQNLPTEQFPWWMAQLQSGDPVEIQDVSQLPAQARAERAILEGQEARSLLALPLRSNAGLMGFLAFENVEVNGSWREVGLMVLRMASEVISNALERKRAEEEGRRLITALEQSAEAIVITASEGTIQYVNPAFERTSGYSWSEVVGKNPRILKSGRHAESFYREMWSTILQGRVWTGLITNRKKDGSLYEEETVISPVRDASGRIANFVAVKRDVTEKRLLEAQLRQAQKLESIGQLAAGIAHEINTPTQYVGDNARFLRDSFKGFISLFQKYNAACEAAKNGSFTAEMAAELEKATAEVDLDYLVQEIPKAIEQSLDGIERISKIVQAMKEFSHPSEGEKKPTDLNRAIESTITVARNEWKYVANMVTDFDPALPLVLCLPGDFNQVILNLIINAAHAIADVVGKDSQRKGTIAVSTRQIGDEVEIRVSDTGTGIPEAVRDRVFDPFFTTKEVGRGTGQGLAIARSVIVDKHGGTISFETEMGKGTTFIIRLPIGTTTGSGSSLEVFPGGPT